MEKVQASGLIVGRKVSFQGDDTYVVEQVELKTGLVGSYWYEVWFSSEGKPVNGGQSYGYEDFDTFEQETAAERYARHLEEQFGDKDTQWYADKPGGKNTRIVKVYHGQRSVHAFVENASGGVFKAAGWVGPAKGVRFESVEAAIERINEVGDHARFGGYLYRQG